MRILITGANGFLGRATMKALREIKDATLVAAVRNRGQLNGIEAYADEIVELDLADTTKLHKIVPDAEIIVHLAAAKFGSPATMFANTVNPTELMFRILEQNRTNLRRFIQISSLSVYALPTIPKGTMVNENSQLEENWQVRDPYTKAKLWQEKVVREQCERLDINYTILRPGSIYGEGAPLLSNRVGLQLPGIPIFLRIGSSAFLPLTHVDSCAQAIKLVVEKDQTEQSIFNIIDDDMPTQGEFLKLYQTHFGRVKRKIYVPYNFFRLCGHGFSLLHRISKGNFPDIFSPYKIDAVWKPLLYSNSKLKSELGWEPVMGLEAAFEALKK